RPLPTSTLFPYTTLFRSHQIHAHGIAAEREEGAVPEREDAAIAPDQIDRQGEQRKADVLAPERHEIGRHMERRGRRQDQIGKRRSEEHTSELQSLTNLVC